MRQYLPPMWIDAAGFGFGCGQEEILPVAGGVDVEALSTMIELSLCKPANVEARTMLVPNPIRSVMLAVALPQGKCYRAGSLPHLKCYP
ncbi:msr9128 (plasmid) [Mesorhizobium japonicum MAFF 303099]|uniref:Msr9128 protein n=1 Tax=Mesorhizobium japonicum (strain LMG 29417 / CECT 9101 / MAFF 303099) TaxID=266835 RepID=Q982D4_RHILO|nr:msr9128 [Mesorhizobium japonicum MAFF 303099]